MPTLRAMIDEMTITAAGIAPPMPAPPPGNAGQPKSKLPQPGQGKFGKSAKGPVGGKGGKDQGSPLANHISSHLNDPLGATKEGFQDLTQKKLAYDQSREEMQRNLKPVQSTIDHVAQIHGLMPGGAGQLPTPGMTPAAPQIDPATGMPMDPNMAGQDPNNPGQNDDPDMQNGTQPPQNMNQTPGQINQNRPSIAGHQPGVSPGPQQSVVPGKMGMPKPGGGTPGQTNKPAAKPKGAGSLPGAKGPGDPKVQGKTNQAQSKSGRQIKINVAASNAIDTIRASSTITTQFGLGMLKAGGTALGAKKNWSTRNKGHLSRKEKKSHYGTMESMISHPGGGGSGIRPMPGGGMGHGGGPARGTSRMFSKRVKAGPASLEDKVSDSGAQIGYNPAGTGSTKLNASKHIKGCMCSKCKGM